MSDTFHILPINDIDEHQETIHCKCKPNVVIKNECTLIIHNAFDKREFVENLTEDINLS